MNKKSNISEELKEIKQQIAAIGEQLVSLKKQIDVATTVRIEEEGKQSEESYANLILDEIVSIKNKLGEAIGAEKNIVKPEGSDGDISLTELKSELMKLADMLSE